MIIDINFVGLIITSIMASAVPLILASCGELITERSGVLNLGVEGMMIIGAISGLGPTFVANNLLRKIRLNLVIIILKFVFNNRKASVICQSVNDRDIITSLGITTKEKISLINGSGVNVKSYSPNKKLLDSKPYVFMASRMLTDKGVKEFCLAAKIVNEHLKRPINFKLSGPIDSESPTCISDLNLRKLCKECDVEYLGNREDMPELLASATIFVLPSYYAEGVPKVLLEASACGVPIITTNHPGCKDAIVDGKTGLLVKPRDSENLANAILQLLMDDIKLTKMGENGRKHALKFYKDTDVVKQHYTLYKKLLNRV